jgi:formylglycine-generating enzyme required for sulfatase activity
MGKYAVSQGQYAAVMGTNPSSLTGRTDLPVENVSWAEAASFCATLTEQERQAGRLPAGQEYRLPTEAEWEYACRAGTTTVFSFGDDPQYGEIAEYGWHSGNSAGQPHPVGAKAPNVWGLHDMHGNVWEWCQDSKGPYPRPSFLPSSDTDRVVRGGSWRSNACDCRSAYRGYGSPDNRYDDVGFRVVQASTGP